MPRQILTADERVRLAVVLSNCDEYFGNPTVYNLDFLEQNLFPLSSTASPIPDDDIFLHALSQLIFYFVAATRDSERLKLVYLVTSTITKLLHERIGQEIPGYGVLKFEAVTQVERAYWVARNWWRQRQFPRRRDYLKKVIRINDIPFAEGIYGELMSFLSDAYLNAIEVVSLPWEQVGNALLYGYIDAAIHNDSIVTSIERRTRRLYKSNRLFSYTKYPVLENTKASIPAGGRLMAVPSKTDFNDVIDDILAHNQGLVNIPNGTESLRKEQIGYVDSADDALERIINGGARFCMTGGIHAQYALRAFKNHGIILRGYLDKATPEVDVRFWVACDSSAIARESLSPLIRLWNQTATRWRTLSDTDDEKYEEDKDRLVELVNSNSHKVFVGDFADLKNLIRDHDQIAANVPLVQGTLVSL
jgi:hypothetical protein